VISNGPFYLDSYSPEARIITIKSFEDATYPFDAGRWSEFENINMPKIVKIDVPDHIVRGHEVVIPIQTIDVSQLYYFVNDASGSQADSGILQVQDDHATILFTKEMTNKMAIGGNDLKLYAVSDSVLRPDIYVTSFLTLESDSGALSETKEISQTVTSTKIDHVGMISLAIGLVIVGTILYARRARRIAQQTH
jgi:peptide/nickel transport system substrate-binding protein